jgi:hypothetical protein
MMKPRIGFLLVSATLLATGLSSMAVAAQSQTSEPECYSTCASTSTWLNQSKTLLLYGNEQLQAFHVTVQSTVLGLGQTPTGTVAIKSGSTTLCTIVLSIRGGSCSPSPQALPAGFQSVRGYYSGDANFSASVSNVRTFQIRDFGKGD